MAFSATFVSPDMVWKQLAKEIGGQYWEAFPEYYSRGGSGRTVHLKVEEWPISLETYMPTYGREEPGPELVRMRAPYQDKDGFRFAISRKHLLTGIMKILGGQDIETGDPAFDDEFVIQGNDEAKVRALFASPRLKHSIQAQPYVLLQTEGSEVLPGSTLLGAGSAELHFILNRDQTGDIARLKSLFELLAEALRQLRRIGSA